MARIPKDVPLDAIAPVLCAGITVYKGLKESGARPGQTVAIVGAGGGLGSLACQYAKAMGLRIIAIDAGDEKKEMTNKLGAESFVDFSKSDNVVKDVQGATEDGLGPHAVLLVAVNEKPFQQAAEYVRPHGTVVRSLFSTTEKVQRLISVAGSDRVTSRRLPPRPCLRVGKLSILHLPIPATDSPHQVIKMITIKGSYVGNRKDTSEAINFFRRGLIRAPFKTIGMSELQKVYDLMRTSTLCRLWNCYHC